MENADKICSRLRRALEEGPFTGEVTNVEEHEITIELPVGTMHVISGESLRPFSLRVDSVQPFPAFGIEPGSRVLVSTQGVDFPDTELEISLALATDADLSVRAGALFMPDDLKLRLSYLSRALELSAEKGTFSEIALSTGASVPMEMDRRLGTLFEAMTGSDMTKIETAAADCAGLGEGEIPASDRLLGGVIEAYTAFGCALGRKEERVDEITEAIFRGAAANTTGEAAFHLAIAAAGLADEEMCQLFRCLFSDRSYTALLSAAVSAAGRSGADALSGVSALLSKFAF